MTIEGPSAQREKLAAELRSVRLLAGMSDAEIERQIGLSHASVSELETAGHCRRLMKLIIGARR